MSDQHAARVMRGPLATPPPPRVVQLDADSFGLQWSPIRVVGNGLWRVQTASPTSVFWSAWNSHKDALKKLGLKISKNPKTNKFEVARFLPPDDAEAARRAAIRDASRASDGAPSYPAPDGLTRYPFQNAGVEFSMGKMGVLIGDEPGLGKTNQAIGVIDACSAQSALIICPASLKLNWERELSMWMTRKLSVGIAHSGKTWPDRQIVVINYDILGAFDAKIKARQWDVLVLDEAHYVKQAKSRRAKMIFGNRNEGIRKIEAKRRIALTGTPIPNRPVELWPIVHFLNPEEWNSWPSFARRYCGASEGSFSNVKGATNLEELQRRLRETVMVRRLKADVLKELPPKTRQLMVLPSTGAEHQIAAEMSSYTGMKSRIAELRARFELSKASPVDGDHTKAVAALREGVAAAFAEMARMRKAVAIAKLPALLDHLDSALESSPKVVCFVHHREVHDAVSHHYEGVCSGIIGGDKVEDRQAAVDAFQTDDKIKVFVGSIGAAGVGITLTASSHVVMGELDWVPGNMTQAEDRCHRISQRDNVLAQWIVLEGSLDSKMAKTIMQKADIIDRALDRKTDAPVEAPENIITSVSVFEDEAAATREANRDRITKDAEKLEVSDISVIHRALQAIAAMDLDGARARNEIGFAKIDSRIGRALAEKIVLTSREAALGLHIVHKYHRQLGSISADINGIWDRVHGETE